MTASITPLARWLSVLCLGAAAPMLISGRGLFFVLFAVGAAAGLIARPRLFADTPKALLSGSRSATGIAVGLLMVLWAIAAVRTIDPDWSPVVFALLLGLSLLIPALTVGYAGDPVSRKLTLKTIIIAAWVAVILIFVGVYVWPQLFEIIRQREVDHGTLILRFLKSYGAVIPLMSFLMIWAGSTAGRPWFVAAVIYALVGVFIVYQLGNKSAILTYAGGIVGALLCTGLSKVSARTAWLCAGLILAALGAVLALIFANLPDLPYTRESTPTLPTGMIDAHRQIIWSFILEKAGERPWFGWGLGTAGRLPGAKNIIPGFTVQYVPSHPHNWVLQVWVESGVLALIALWAVIILLARHVARLCGRDYPGAVCAAAVLGGFLAGSLVNFSFFAAWWLVVFALFFSLPLSAAWAAKDQGRSG